MISGSLIFLYVIGSLATIAAGASGLLISYKKGFRVPKWLPWLLAVLPLYLLAGQLLKLYAHKNYLDFSVSYEVILNITRGQGPWSSLQENTLPGSGHWFSAHFTPVVYLYALLLAAVRRPETLIVSQWAILLSALLGVFLYARKTLGSKEYGYLAALVLLLFPAYQYIHLYEFEFLRLSIPLLLFTFYALEEGRLRMYWVLLALSLLVREEVSLTTFLLGFYAVLFMRDKRWVGAVTMAISIAYFLVVLEVVMPYFQGPGAPEHVAAYWFAKLGTTMSGILVGILTKPDVVLSLVTDPIKLANLFMYGLPLLFLPLLAWPVLLITAANVGVALLGPRSFVSYFLYYLSPSIPFLFIAFVKGTARLGRWLDGRWAAPAGERGGTGAVLCGVLSAAVAANFFFGPSPLSLQFWASDYKLAPFRTQNFHYSQYIVTDHARKLKETLAVIPEGAKVSAEQHILPALAGRADLKVFPDITGVGYVVLDKRRKEKTGVGTVPGSWYGLRENPQYYYDWVERDPAHWQLVFRLDGYFVYKKRENRS